jgi:hypothetical protein
LSQDNSKLPQRDFFWGWHLIIMVVLFLQIEITISFHKNQSSLDLMTYTVWVEVLFWSNFFVSNMFLSLLFWRGVLSTFVQIPNWTWLSYYSLLCFVAFGWQSTHVGTMVKKSQSSFEYFLIITNIPCLD